MIWSVFFLRDVIIFGREEDCIVVLRFMIHERWRPGPYYLRMPFNAMLPLLSYHELHPLCLSFRIVSWRVTNETLSPGPHVLLQLVHPRNGLGAPAGRAEDWVGTLGEIFPRAQGEILCPLRRSTVLDWNCMCVIFWFFLLSL